MQLFDKLEATILLLQNIFLLIIFFLVYVILALYYS